MIEYNLVYNRNYLNSKELESLHSMFPLELSECIPYAEDFNVVDLDLVDASGVIKEIEETLSKIVARDYLATGYIGDNYFVDLFDIGDDFINVIIEFVDEEPVVIMLAIYHKGLVS